MKKKIYSYDDWLKGVVYLETSSTESTIYDTMPRRVKLDDFDTKSQEKIRIKQKEIFDVALDKLFIPFKNNILQRLDKSVFKRTFLERQITEIYKKSTFTQDFKPPSDTIESFNLLNTAQYFDEAFIDGYFDEPDFMNSPNFVFAPELDSKLYAHFLLQAFLWLRQLQIEHEEIKKPKVKRATTKKKVDSLHELFKSEIKQDPKFDSNYQSLLQDLVQVKNLKGDEMIEVISTRQYKWLTPRASGNIKMMVGFINVLIEAKLIDIESSGTTLSAINGTFNACVKSPTSFKTDSIINIDEAYKAPFRKIVMKNFNC